jgi:glycosyltransferase involved in cell wall biosynthesis
MKKVLHLASWYPNKNSPFEGDFIQRHAIAISNYIQVTVLHVTQYGPAVEVKQTEITETKSGNLTEIIIHFRFKKTNITFVDKIRYNLKYFYVYKKFIRHYFKKEGVPDLIHLHIPVKAGLIAGWIKRKWGIPYILSEHSGHYVKNSLDYFDNRNLYYKKNVRRIFVEANAVTNVSFHDANLLKELFGIKEVIVIRNTADTGFFNFINTPGKKIRFIHVSSLGYQKNIEGILRTFHKLRLLQKDWELVLVGEITNTVNQLINELELQHLVICTGQISYQEVARQMQHSSAFVLFSRYENFPCVIVEALCCGLPVIATSVAGIPEAINNNNGILVESENEGQLLNALQKMLNNYSQYEQAKIAEDAQQLYSYEIIGKQFFDLYNEVLKNN